MQRIGHTDLEVFPVCLGGNVFGWTADHKTSFTVLDAYAGASGNFNLDLETARPTEGQR